MNNIVCKALHAEVLRKTSWKSFALFLYEYIFLFLLKHYVIYKNSFLSLKCRGQEEQKAERKPLPLKSP